jgi:hypothetical protein
MFYTIVPIEYIFGEEEPEPDDPPKNNDNDEEIEIKRGSVSLMVRPHLPGQYKINRIISTNPHDYLRPDWQPGTIMNL